MSKIIYTILSIMCLIFFILGIVDYHNDIKIMIFVLLIIAVIEITATIFYLIFKKKEQ